MLVDIGKTVHVHAMTRLRLPFYLFFILRCLRSALRRKGGSDGKEREI